jgi:hypothetical protein
MPKFSYVAWFRDDPFQPPQGETHEWTACFYVEAENDKLALVWGDHLAHNYATRKATTFYRSYLDEATWQPVPVVKYGQEASDEDIGW